MRLIEYVYTSSRPITTLVNVRNMFGLLSSMIFGQGKLVNVTLVREKQKSHGILL